jgi:hypothetical protein
MDPSAGNDEARLISQQQTLAPSMSQPTHDQVVAAALRLILLGIKDVAGNQFPKILESVELSQYVADLPPDDDSPTISRSKVGQLYAASRQVLGETMLRQILLKSGHRLPDLIMAGPAGQEMKALTAQVPASERLGAAIRVLAEKGAELWAEMTFSEDKDYYYLEVSYCSTCSEIRGAREPVCANIEYALGMLARALSGGRVFALEIACAAVGAPRCKYRFRK